MCSSPVTLGGGIAIENLGLGLCASASNRRACSQRAYQAASMAAGSYAGGIGNVEVGSGSVLIFGGWACLDSGIGEGRRRAELARARRPEYGYGYFGATHGESHLNPA